MFKPKSTDWSHFTISQVRALRVRLYHWLFTATSVYGEGDPSWFQCSFVAGKPAKSYPKGRAKRGEGKRTKAKAAKATAKSQSTAKCKESDNLTRRDGLFMFFGRQKTDTRLELAKLESELEPYNALSKLPSLTLEQIGLWLARYKQLQGGTEFQLVISQRVASLALWRQHAQGLRSLALFMPPLGRYNFWLGRIESCTR
jgi:hypothetical protein